MLIDSRGNLFGRFNLVDAAVALFIVVLVPMSYVAYRVFRIPPPVVLAVTPGTLTAEMPMRVRMTGRYFRPYLEAYVAKTGAPFSVNSVREMTTNKGTFSIVTPDEVEIVLPRVGPGTYDIHLYDDAQEVAWRQSAFTVALPPRATVEALVRFIVPAETVPEIREGDRDRWEEGGNNMVTPSELATLGPVRVTKATVTFLAPNAEMPGVALEATVRIPAKARQPFGWEYKSARVRAGETLIFETDRYFIRGLIERITELPAASTGGR